MSTLASLKNEEKFSVDEFMCLLFKIEPGKVNFNDGDSKDWPSGAGLVFVNLMENIKTKQLQVAFENQESNPFLNEQHDESLFSKGAPWLKDGKLLKSELEEWCVKENSTLRVCHATYPFNPKFYYLSKEWLTKKPPEPKFCVKPLVPIGAVTLLNAHGGTGKSIFALKMAIHIALGLPIIGAETYGEKVAYMSLEDSADIVHHRIFKIFKALPKKYQRLDEIVDNKIMILDRYGLPTYMAEKQQYGNISTPPFAESLSTLLMEHEIKCVFVDTLVRTNPLNENDNAEMGRLLVTYEGIAKAAKCGVVLIHHLPKVNLNRSYSARGASAITDNARSALLLQTVPKSYARRFAGEKIKAAILEERLIEVEHTKHNYSAKYPNQYLMKIKGGILQEVSPASSLPAPALDPDSAQKQRYKELYDWWDKTCKPAAITKNKISDEVAEAIRQLANVDRHGKKKYKNALEWAFNNGFAENAPRQKGWKPDADYYILKSPVDDTQAPF